MLRVAVSVGDGRAAARPGCEAMIDAIAVGRTRNNEGLGFPLGDGNRPKRAQERQQNR